LNEKNADDDRMVEKERMLHYGFGVVETVIIVSVE